MSPPAMETLPPAAHTHVALTPTQGQCSALALGKDCHPVQPWAPDKRTEGLPVYSVHSHHAGDGRARGRTEQAAWGPPTMTCPPGRLPAQRTRPVLCKEQVPFFRPKIHMVSRASISVRPSPNHSLNDLDTGFSSSWPQANLRYPAHAWRKASTTAF